MLPKLLLKLLKLLLLLKQAERTRLFALVKPKRLFHYKCEIAFFLYSSTSTNMGLKYISIIWVLWSFFVVNLWAGAANVPQVPIVASYHHVSPTAQQPTLPAPPHSLDDNDNALFGMWSSFILAILFSFPFLLLFLIGWITTFMWIALGLFVLTWVIGMVLMRFILVHAKDPVRDRRKRLSAKIGLVLALLLAFVNIFAVLLH
jgi:hypothetical protein